MKKRIAAVLLAIMILLIPLNGYAVSREEVLQKGDKDKWVTELQQALYKKGYMKQSPTGYFGTVTEAAVLKFQKANKLVADGKAGPVTRKKLLGSAYKAMSGRKLSSSAQTQSVETIYPGDRGQKVSEIQKRLKALGYHTYTNITEYFGPVTQDAIKRFQRANDLEMDGIVGTKTWNKLFSSSAKAYVIYPGDSGDDVVKLQNRLKELKYYSGRATGYYGNVTQNALKQFQKANGLTADGKVGQKTLAVLYSSSAKKGNVESSTTQNNSQTVQPPASTANNSEKAQALVAFAKTHIGKKYVYAAAGPNTFDCSGFVQYVYKHIGITVARGAGDQARMSKYQKITKISDLKVGDLMGFKTNAGEVGHTGIYIGNNQFIHCDSLGVRINTFGDGNNGSWYQARFQYARRILP